MSRELPSKRLDRIVAALTEAARAKGGNQPDTPSDSLGLTRAAAFTSAQLRDLPDLFRAPMIALTHGFDLWGFFSAGRPFHRQSLGQRRRQLQRWRDSRFGLWRNFARFYDSLAALGGAATGLVSPPPQAFSTPRSGGGKNRGEVVVIGSGPGGAVTAALLAEAGRQVTLIEEGPAWPLESCEPFSPEEMRQKYRNGGLTPALGRAAISYAEGRCVGGGSEINSGLYHRTPADVLERWRTEFGVADLSPAELQPHFEACERDLTVSLIPGGGAPEASLRLHRGAERKGWRSLEVPRWFKYGAPDADGVPRGTRQSMSKTFVPRALHAGATLVDETRVTRLRRTGQRWLIEARHRANGATLLEAENVFVCGGAVQTPALLLRSGIAGPVGRSLQMHPTVKMIARFPDEVNSARMGVPVHQVKEFAERFSFGCSISSPPFLDLGMLDHPADREEVAAAWQCCAVYYAMIVPEARGSVRAVPGFDDPLVRFPLTPADFSTLADALRRLGETLFAAGAIALYPSVRGLGRFDSPDDLRRIPAALAAERTSLMTIHLFSSCPMGERRDRCVTDSFGRVHGHRNLHLADASLLCSAPGVNPQGSIMAICRRNAEHFLHSL